MAPTKRRKPLSEIVSKSVKSIAPTSPSKPDRLSPPILGTNLKSGSNCHQVGEKEIEDKYRLPRCPTCGKRQKIYAGSIGNMVQCNSWHCDDYFYINDDLTLRKLTKQESHDLMVAWVAMVKSLGKCAVVGVSQ